MPAFPPVRKAVVPVAGLGTRFLPATKSVPKEMLPVLDKPLIQYAVEEAAEAGIETIVLVTRGNKSAIADHFRRDASLESFLDRKGDTERLTMVKGILPAGMQIVEVVQEEPLGLGHAVLCAREQVGDEPFAVILPDDLIRASGVGCLAQMVGVYSETGSSVVGVEQIPRHLTGSYGVAEVEEGSAGRLEIKGLVEKPEPDQAPSNLGVVGRYLLPPDLFPVLAGIGAGAGGEIQLTDGIAALLGSHEVLAFPFEGARYDCGSRLGLLRATLDYAREDPELAPALDSTLGPDRPGVGG